VKNRILLALMLCSCSIFAQTTRVVRDEEQLWVGYFNQTRLTDKWGIWFDTHFRTTEHFIKEPSKFLGRLGVMYYLNDDLKFTIAYNYVNHFPKEGHANVSQPEHRIWHQLQLHTKYGKVRTMQWIRFEERFRKKVKNDNELADGKDDDCLSEEIIKTRPLMMKVPLIGGSNPHRITESIV